MIPAALRLGLVLWLLATLPTWWLGRSVALGVLVGGGLGLANLWALARIVAAAARAKGGRSALLGLLLATKFLALAACVVASLRYLRVQPLAFCAGLSIFVVALLASGARRAVGVEVQS
jgi:ATP synthase I subunit